MYSLRLTCRAEEVEDLSVALWDAGTVGIREAESGAGIELVAGFDKDSDGDRLTLEFAGHSPRWEREDDTDWVAATHLAWPPREIGERVFLTPVWNSQETPSGRVRVTHNPGLASGTGEHPCTRLALESLERCVLAGSLVVDVGAGSGILSVAALRLGARAALALDIDIASLQTARETFSLNACAATVAAGSADCIQSEAAEVVVANISGTVLLAIADELLRILSPAGWLILTGFPDSELAVLQQAFGKGDVTEMNGWRCLTLRF